MRNLIRILCSSSKVLGFLFFVTLASNVVQSDDDAFVDLSSLRFVHSIFRHGDRNPASTFPSDLKNVESTWKEGFGELTNLGILQQYKLGQYIKQRYKGFLSEAYSSKEIHVRSTSYNRTIMSAAANLAGMYPPVGQQIWNKNLMWQPIPVHSRPREIDPMLWMDLTCPTVSDLYKNKVLKSQAYIKAEGDNADFLEFLRVKTGLKSVPLIDLWNIFDPLNCETIHNDTHQRPDWVTDEVFTKIVELYRLSALFYYNIPEIQRLRGALMFHDIASRFVDKAANTSSYVQDLKYYAYSIHDTTQIALLENFGAYDGVLPTYDEVLFVELHEINGSHFVKVFKRNTTEGNNVFHVTIPSCGETCELNKFYKLSSANKPDDWNKECGLDAGVPSPRTTQILGLLTGLCILFFVLFVLLLAFYIRLRRSGWATLQE